MKVTLRQEAGAQREIIVRFDTMDDEVRAVIKAAATVDAIDGWEGDLYRLVLLLAATGARFSQVAAIRVGDVESVDTICKKVAELAKA